MSKIDYFLCNNIDMKYDINDIVENIKELKKYNEVIIVRDDPESTTAIIKLDENKSKYTKSDFTFHLPKSKRVKSDSELLKCECSICKENFKCNEFYRGLPECNHLFHKKCIDQWFFKSQKYECPYCRNNFYSLKKKSL
tara:strand:+ start:55 stop:471 length:417 start_codon:yes stop_codon:yes gene_type:complete